MRCLISFSERCKGQSAWRRWDHGGGAWGWWQAHGAVPATLVCRCVFAKSPAYCVEGGIMATIPSGKNKTTGIMLNDHVGKILGRWIRPKILQIDPLLVARSQAIGSARRGAVMTQFTTRVFFDVARIRGLSAASIFCDLAASYYSVVRQYVVGSDLPEQRLLVLMDILGLNFWARCWRVLA